MKFNISKKWIMDNAHKEEGQSIEAGSPPVFPPPDTGSEGTPLTNRLAQPGSMCVSHHFYTPAQHAIDLESQLTSTRHQLEQARRERDNWIQSAKEFSTGLEFYRDLIIKIGEPFGVAAKTSDDGSIQQDVLALKVPELVADLRSQLSQLQKEVGEANRRLGYWAEFGAQFIPATDKGTHDDAFMRRCITRSTSSATSTIHQFIKEVSSLRTTLTTTQAELATAKATIEGLEKDKTRLREALKEIAKQDHSSEMENDEKEYADFEDAYNMMILTARAASQGTKKEGA